MRAVLVVLLIPLLGSLAQDFENFVATDDYEESVSNDYVDNYNDIDYDQVEEPVQDSDINAKYSYSFSVNDNSEQVYQSQSQALDNNVS